MEWKRKGLLITRQIVILHFSDCQALGPKYRQKPQEARMRESGNMTYSSARVERKSDGDGKEMVAMLVAVGWWS